MQITMSNKKEKADPRAGLQRDSSKRNDTQSVTVAISGMSCAACAVNVEQTLRSLPGIANANVNFANQSAFISYDPHALDLSKARKAVQDTGYDLLIPSESNNKEFARLQEEHYRTLHKNTLLAFAFSIPVVFLSMSGYADHYPYLRWIEFIFSAPVVFLFGRQFFINAYRQACHRKANMDTLVALSTGIAFMFSAINTLFPDLFGSKIGAPVYYESASVVIAFILLGRLLEQRAKVRTSEALKKLIALQPSTVRIIRNGLEEDVPLAQVQQNDAIIIRPGERIPVDGSVISGSTYIDESSLTGEPIAVEKTKGSNVFAGTLNQRGSITIVAQAVGETTLLAQIIKRVEAAQGSKAPVERLVDKVAGIFVPVVIGIAALTFIIWLVAGGISILPQALLTSVTVLIIACPCALGLATPTVLIVSMGKAAENGILIRDAESLETAHRINAVVIDKTGTITEGAPRTTQLTWHTKDNVGRLSAILYAMERRSEHPLAAAISSYLEKNTSLPFQGVSLENIETLVGKGVRAMVDTKYYYVGSSRFANEHGVVLSLDKEDGNSSSLIYFFTDDQLLSTIAVQDPIKPGSAEAIHHLRSLGISVTMLTGDSNRTAEVIAKETGIDTFKGELLPHDKAEYIQHLQNQHKIVAMVGDGINDSEALAQADVAIAMGKGADIAMEVAQMTIISSDLRQLSKAIQLSRATVRTIKQNLFWAFVYNVVGIPIAAGALYPFTGFLLNPMIAGAAMALSSVSVVSNSLRLKQRSL